MSSKVDQQVIAQYSVLYGIVEEELILTPIDDVYIIIYCI